MSSYHAAVSAARHAGRRALARPSAPAITSCARRPLGGASASHLLTVSDGSAAATSPSAAASTRIPIGVRRFGGSSSASSSSAPAGQPSSFAAIGMVAATLTIVGAHATTSLSTTSCESNEVAQTGAGLADETEEGNGANVVVRDGMDAGSETPKLDGADADGSAGPADAEEDNGDGSGDSGLGEYEREDDDDPSKDEDTTCSICLINRQGPCRKYWLKFERCMKAHGAEKDRRQAEEDAALMAGEEIMTESKGEVGEDGVSEGDGSGAGGEPSMEDEWDAFMEKSVKPGEDDDDEDDEDDEDDDDEDEEDDESEEKASEDASEKEDKKEDEMDMSLAQRCDRFMMPWISCIQEHRNVYSLISNAFYQKDYVDPLEDSISDGRRREFEKRDAEIGEVDGYLMRFHGVEVDLGNWREHVEADADESGEEAPVAATGEEPHLINAYAKFRLVDPADGKRPIEVAYIKDQRGRLLGFDSFTKRDDGGDDGDANKDDGLNDSDSSEKSAAANSLPDGECTFHIVPGETTSVVAYAIYRGEKKEDEGEGSGGGGMREDYLYKTPEVPLPGVHNQKQ